MPTWPAHIEEYGKEATKIEQLQELALFEKQL